MNYITFRKALQKQMDLYIDFMQEIDDDEIIKIAREIHNLKSRIAEIDDMTQSQCLNPIKTILMVIESKMKFCVNI